MRISPSNIMCAVDFSGFAPRVLAYGKALAGVYNARLFACHILPDAALLSSHASPGFSSPETMTRRLDDASKSVHELARSFDVAVTPLVALGHAGDQIPLLAREHRMDLVIAAAHGKSGIKRFLVGSVTARLIKTLECPLLVLHAPHKEKSNGPPFKRILAGCDFSPGSELALAHALSLAQEFEAELHLLHVIKPHHQIEMGTSPYLVPYEGESMAWPGFGHLKESAQGDEFDRRQRMLRDIEDRLAGLVPDESRNWCTPVIRVRQGEPYQELIAYARKHDIDLMVLGVHGHSLLEEFLVGSTTDRVVGRAECPVLAVRQPVAK